MIVGSDNLVFVNGLTDNSTGSPITSASVAGELFAPDGTSVTTFSMPSVGSGNYQGTIPHTVSLTNSTQYRVVVTATSGSNVRVFQFSDVATD